MLWVLSILIRPIRQGQEFPFAVRRASGRKHISCV